MNYFGKEATDKFDAIVFGVPIKMKDEVLNKYFMFCQINSWNIYKSVFSMLGSKEILWYETT